MLLGKTRSPVSKRYLGQSLALGVRPRQRAPQVLATQPPQLTAHRLQDEAAAIPFAAIDLSEQLG